MHTWALAGPSHVRPHLCSRNALLTHLMRMRCRMLMMPLPLLHFVRLARRRLDHLAGQPAPPAYPSPARPEAALAASDQTDAWRLPVPARSVGAAAYAVL